MKTVAITAAALIFAITAQSAQAGPFGANAALTKVDAGQSIVKVFGKRCKYMDADGYIYKAPCPRGMRKGSRGKRAGIGAGIGAGLGAALGFALGGSGKTAAFGALAGAAAGSLGGAASVRKCWYENEYGEAVKAACNQ
ncbi:MAG: hypothetical protein AAGE61_21865 [Pseudomonadota bacterium]